MDLTSWQTLTDQQIEKEYSPSQWVQRIKVEEVAENHVNTLKKASDESRAQVPHERIIYGPGEEQMIEIFGADILPNDAPILIFIHGGYWQYLSLDVSAHLAKAFYEHGVVVTSLGYDMCPKVRFEELVRQTKQAVAKVIEIALQRGSCGVYVCGPSAGGHLTAMMLATDWSEYGVDGTMLKGGAPISGIFDLRPFCRHSDNTDVKLDEKTAWEFSPQRLISKIKGLDRARRIRVIVAEYDSPEFKRQSMQFATDLESYGLDATIETIKELDHFNVCENLKDIRSRPTRAILEMMGIIKE